MNFQAFGQAVKDKCNTMIRGSSNAKNGPYPSSLYSNISTSDESVDRSNDFHPEKKRTSYQSKVALEEKQREIQIQEAQQQGYAQGSMDPALQPFPQPMNPSFAQQMPVQQQPFAQQPFTQPSFGQTMQQTQAQPPFAVPMQQPPIAKPAPACMHYVFHLYSREQCKDVIPYIRYNISVVINLEYVTSPHEQQRCLDILCGAAYALNCTITNVLRSIVFMITPRNIVVDVIKWEKQRSNAQCPQAQTMQSIYQPAPDAPTMNQNGAPNARKQNNAFCPESFTQDYPEPNRVPTDGVHYGSGTPSERFQRQRRLEGVQPC